jgi:hypothetical protein
VASGEHRDEHLSLLPDWHNIRGVPELAQLVERRQKGMKAWLQVIQDGIDDGSRCSDIRRGEIRWLLSNVVAAVFDDRFEGTAEGPRPGPAMAGLAGGVRRSAHTSAEPRMTRSEPRQQYGARTGGTVREREAL